MLEKVKTMCKEINLPLYKLEKELGFSNGSLYKLNTSNPSLLRVKKIADYFNVPIESLLE